MTIGLYVHVPFCATKCGYCDFYSHVPAAGEFEPLVRAVLRELDTVRVRYGERVETIFVGGGTPTLLSLSLLDRLMVSLGEIACTDGVTEFTVEANPASLNEAKARILKQHGVNRVSMGAQSFHAHELRVLDRIHHPGDIPPSADIIHRAGFDHFNLDLIFGIPGQTSATWLESIDRAVALGPDHLACYGLTYEPGTALYDRLQGGAFSSMDEVAELSLYEMTLDRLRSAGFERYEISNYARPGAECRHNLRYWRNESSIGVGPSAATYWKGRRWRNVPDTRAYTEGILNGDTVAIDHEELSPEARAGETAMLALRMIDGIDRERFHASTGLMLDTLFVEEIARNVSTGLLIDDGRHLRLSDAGLRVADAVMADFLRIEPERPNPLPILTVPPGDPSAG